jgi:polysaccharide biosynthesis/export protein
MMTRKSALCAVVLLSVWRVSLVAQSVPQAPPASVGAATQTEVPVRTTYLLGPDDQLVVRAGEVPDITDKPQRIDPNGDLRLPLVGRVHAAGMTVEQLERVLTERLKVYLQEPDVSILVTEFRSQPVSVVGAVQESGVRQLEGRKTLIEVLSLAGGLAPEAGPVVRITRRLDVGRIPLPEATTDPTGQFSTVDINATSLMDGRSPEKNITVERFDVISIPRAAVVYVVGEVPRPGGVLLSSGQSISIMEAVSSTGGVLKTASPKQARVLRVVPGQEKRTELNVNLQEIMEGKADDLRLTAGDVLVVPDKKSRGKAITVRAVEAVIQASMIVATYGVVR